MVRQSDFKEFFDAHGKKLIFALVIIVLAVVLVVQYVENRKALAQETAQKLGGALALVYSGNDSLALEELNRQMPSLSGLALAKASLLAGNIKFRAKDFDGASALFSQAASHAGSADLILGGALHGSASVLIEKGKYAEAVLALESFVKKFGQRTGNLKDRYGKNEPTDLLPTVPDALWKLTLCYRELGNAAKAKETAEKLLKIYGDKPEYAMKAQKFLASL